MRIYHLFFIFVIACIILISISKQTEKIDFKELKSVPFVIENNQFLDDFNNKNSKINSIYSNVAISSQGITLNSAIVYEKKIKFRMISESIFGTELDIGSNDQYFWFWSKRMKPSALFYAKHEDLKNTRLRTPFNPNWMIELLGVSNIDKNCSYFEYKNDLVVSEIVTDNFGNVINKLRLIDRNKKSCIAHFLYDKNMNPIISAEIKEFYAIEDCFLPKKIEIFWYEENIKSVWNLSEPKINLHISSDKFIVPNISPKIDLNGYDP